MQGKRDGDIYLLVPAVRESRRHCLQRGGQSKAVPDGGAAVPKSSQILHYKKVRVRWLASSKVAYTLVWVALIHPTTAGKKKGKN